MSERLAVEGRFKPAGHFLAQRPRIVTNRLAAYSRRPGRKCSSGGGPFGEGGTA
ncbi:MULTISPECIES: hypothetical protein [Acidithiobacillus]|uniref:hypothetical protein n=1 Tax=Acidithiobacillus TaxID=119977 RepID=UPI000AC07208|nr:MULTISPECIES: hypothetical protein [Acidithiobacillus]MBU2743022.1 hypothetical protein [Acidithiobacillus albertensis]